MLVAMLMYQLNGLYTELGAGTGFDLECLGQDQDPLPKGGHTLAVMHDCAGTW